MTIVFAGLEFDATEPVSIAIPMRFDGDQPNAFGVSRATSQACEAGELVGDTRRGGSCNFERVSFIPHCNGTHTECVGHIVDERIAVIDCLRDPLSIATLISVDPERADETTDSYFVQPDPNDRLVTRRSLDAAFSVLDPQLPVDFADSPRSLIVRTVPNDESKLSRTYDTTVPPFFSIEAMQMIVEIGYRHLLVDLPSIDRIYDDGRLGNHRIFWVVEPGSRSTGSATRVRNTVSELIFVPDSVRDGTYLLNLQIAPFAADAAPSRPLLFPRAS